MRPKKPRHNPEDYNLPDQMEEIEAGPAKAASEARAGAAQRLSELEKRIFDELEADNLSVILPLIQKYLLYAFIAKAFVNPKMAMLAISAAKQVPQVDPAEDDADLDSALSDGDDE